MKDTFDIQELIKRGGIRNELELERAFIADRKLRLLSKENPELKQTRKKLRDLIEEYEKSNWSENSNISSHKIRESDLAESIAKKEALFVKQRKTLIKQKLKSMNMTQQQLGIILGHTSKSYMSELMNGVCPFSLRDIIVIHHLLKIDLTDLIPAFLSLEDQKRIKSSIEAMNNTDLNKFDFDFELA